MSGEQDELIAVLRLEYEQLKNEQRARIGFRDNLIYASLAATAAVLVAVIQGGHDAELLLLLPPVYTLFGWTYLINDQKIFAVGCYIREELGPRIAELTGADRLFGWEAFHRNDRHRVTRKVIQLSMDLLLFCGVPSAALIVYWASGPLRPVVLAVSVGEVSAVVLLAQQIVSYAELMSVGDG